MSLAEALAAQQAHNEIVSMITAINATATTLRIRLVRRGRTLYLSDTWPPIFVRRLRHPRGWRRHLRRVKAARG